MITPEIEANVGQMVKTAIEKVFAKINKDWLACPDKNEMLDIVHDVVAKLNFDLPCRRPAGRQPGTKKDPTTGRMVKVEVLGTV
jgi:hypothetical protein